MAGLPDVVFDAEHALNLARFWDNVLDSHTLRPFDDEDLAWMSPYPKLRELIRNLWDGNTGLRSVFHLAPDRLAESHREHRKLMERIKAGDGDGAGKLALDHKLAVGNALVASLESEGAKEGEREASA